MADPDHHLRDADRPIGYWLKRADALLTLRTDEAHEAHDLTCLSWQVLNVLRQINCPSLADVSDALVPFAGRPTLAQALRAFAERGVVVDQGAAGYALTPAGEDLLARADETQNALRQRATDGISEADCHATTRTLRRLVDNLERAAPAS